MKAFKINQNDAGQRLDRFVKKVAPTLPNSLMSRYIRIKRIKINNKRGENSTMLAVGDLVELYINDEFFATEENTPNDFLKAKNTISIVYEDENILLVDKPVGVVVHEDNSNDIDTLINRIKRYLFEKGEYNPQLEHSFAPALCNRIDRNTGGIVIAAKNAASLRVINNMIKERLVDKIYLCVVHGTLAKKSGKLKSFMLKNEKENKVFVYDTPQKDAKTAITGYKVLQEQQGLSLLEVELFTGRTHQIRAQFAYLGHPLLGDTKYGTNKQNQGFNFKHQALYSYKLRFVAGENAEHLAYLNNKTFAVNNIDFLKLFNGYTME